MPPAAAAAFALASAAFVLSAGASDELRLPIRWHPILRVRDGRAYNNTPEGRGSVCSSMQFAKLDDGTINRIKSEPKYNYYMFTSLSSPSNNVVYTRTDSDFADTKPVFGWSSYELCVDVDDVEDCVWVPSATRRSFDTLEGGNLTANDCRRWAFDGADTACFNSEHGGDIRCFHQGEQCTPPYGVRRDVVLYKLGRLDRAVSRAVFVNGRCLDAGASLWQGSGVASCETMCEKEPQCAFFTTDDLGLCQLWASCHDRVDANALEGAWTYRLLARGSSASLQQGEKEDEEGDGAQPQEDVEDVQDLTKKASMWASELPEVVVYAILGALAIVCCLIIDVAYVRHRRARKRRRFSTEAATVPPIQVFQTIPMRSSTLSSLSDGGFVLPKTLGSPRRDEEEEEEKEEMPAREKTPEKAPKKWEDDACGVQSLDVGKNHHWSQGGTWSKNNRPHTDDWNRGRWNDDWRNEEWSHQEWRSKIDRPKVKGSDTGNYKQGQRSKRPPTDKQPSTKERRRPPKTNKKRSAGEASAASSVDIVAARASSTMPAAGVRSTEKSVGAKSEPRCSSRLEP